jgi:hypothetical protein
MDPATGKDAAPLMFSKEDDLTVWQSVRRYRMVGVIAMAAAFSASLDGYRKFQHKWFESDMRLIFIRRDQPQRRHRFQ